MCSGGKGTVIIAVCGKGGVGKTSISAIITRVLAGGGGRVLAIDADPAKGLAFALGFEGRKSVDDIRNGLISKVKQGKGGDKRDISSALDYDVFEALEERENVAFLAIGRPEKEGCYCQVNSMLKDIIHDITSSFNFVVIDGEAGIEQVNRRVLEKVTHLVMVSDVSVKGINVARTILQVSENAVSYEEAVLLLNRVRDGDELARIQIPGDLRLIGWVPEDDAIRELDLQGKALVDMPETSAVAAVRKALSRMTFTPSNGSHCRCGN